MAPVPQRQSARGMNLSTVPCASRRQKAEFSTGLCQTWAFAVASIISHTSSLTGLAAPTAAQQALTLALSPGEALPAPRLTPELSLIHQLPQRACDRDRRTVCPCRAQSAGHPSEGAFPVLASAATSGLSHALTAVEPTGQGR